MAITVDIRIEGDWLDFDDLNRRVNRAIGNGLLLATPVIARRIQRQCVRLAPRRTGRLRRSLRGRAIRLHNGRGSAIAIDGVFYWPFVNSRRAIIERAINASLNGILTDLANAIRSALEFEFN